MTRSTPEDVLAGRQTGRWCDACNRSVRTGDPVLCYATFYNNEGWVPRRLWCRDCGFTTIDPVTHGTDEAIVTAIFWNHRLVSVQLADRSRPEEGDSQ